MNPEQKTDPSLGAVLRVEGHGSDDDAKTDEQDEPKRGKQETKKEETPEEIAIRRLLQDAETLIRSYYQSQDVYFTFNPGGFYIDLKSLRVNIGPDMARSVGMTNSEILFGIFHEAEHFRDMIQNVEEYKKMFAYIDSLGQSVSPDYKSALKRFVNIIDDVMVNMSVMGRWRQFGPKDLAAVYRKLFPSDDMTHLPLQTQFSDAMIREIMIPGERCKVDPVVRAILDEHLADARYTPKQLLQYISAYNPNTQQAMKNPAQRYGTVVSVFEPIFRNLFEQSKNRPKPPSKKGEGERKPADPSGFDQIDHDEMLNEVGKLKQKIDEEKKERNPLPFDTKDVVAYMKEYDAKIKPLVAPLVNFFKQFLKDKIVVERETRISAREPILAPARLNDAYIHADAGSLEGASVYVQEESIEKMEQIFTDFEITIVIDGSGSMVGMPKEKAQRIATLAILEATVQFQEEVNKLQETGEPVKMDLKTQVREFADTDIMLKDFDEPFDMKARIALSRRLKSLSGGSNNEMDTLARIEGDVRKKRTAITGHRLKKLVIFLTDGDTGAPVGDVMRNMEAMVERSPNFAFVAVGIGPDTSAVETTYYPNGRPNIMPEAVPELLLKELKDFYMAEHV